MDFEAYVAARRDLFAREAVDLGCPEDDAPALVEEVLRAHEHRIRRAEDPDRVSLAALERAVGRRGRPPGPVLAALVAGFVLLLVAATVGDRTGPAPVVLGDDAVPSLFGYDRADAEAALASRGLRVRSQVVRTCEVAGRVLRSRPPAGSEVDPGDAVTIEVATPGASTSCPSRYAERLLAWQFLDFVSGRGEAPRFARSVRLVVDRSDYVTLSREQATGDSARGLRIALSDLRDAARRVVRDDDTILLPQLSVTGGEPPPPLCGIGPPAGAADRWAVTLSVDTPDAEVAACPVTVALYSSSQGIDGVVLWTAKDDPAGEGRR